MVYQGNVRATGTNLTATAGRLVILLPPPEGGKPSSAFGEQPRLQSLTAEEKVVVDYEEVHATGDWACYSEDTGLVQLKGQPTWRMGQREGSGDELTFDRTNKVFRSTGHARLQTPASGMGGFTFLSTNLVAASRQSAADVVDTGQPRSAETPLHPMSPAPTNEFVEVLCDSYVIQTNLAVFRKDVRVTDRRGGEKRKGR